MQRGGFVMWLLLCLSLVAATLAVERCSFWIATNHPGRLANVRRMGQMLRAGQTERVRRFAVTDRSVYGAVVSHVLEEMGSTAAWAEAVEIQRPRLERFMPALSTIITAAPMLGILGTVLGLMGALNIVGSEQSVTDPRLISPAIAQALLTTAAGLVVALVVLFPYNVFRAQVDRTLGRMEALVAAADETGFEEGTKDLKKARRHEGTED